MSYSCPQNTFDVSECYIFVTMIFNLIEMSKLSEVVMLLTCNQKVSYLNLS